MVTEVVVKYTQLAKKVTIQLFTSTAAGKITAIDPGEKGKTVVQLQQLMVNCYTNRSCGLRLSVKVNDIVKADQALT